MTALQLHVCYETVTLGCSTFASLRRVTGRTFFLNIQDPGHTFAIWGPFPRRNAGGQRAMGSASPRHRWKPKVSAELREHATKNDMSPYEAAAYERLGVALG